MCVCVVLILIILEFGIISGVLDTCYQDEPSFGSDNRWFGKKSFPAMPSLQLLQLTERGRGLVASRR